MIKLWLTFSKMLEMKILRILAACYNLHPPGGALTQLSLICKEIIGPALMLVSFYFICTIFLPKGTFIFDATRRLNVYNFVSLARNERVKTSNYVWLIDTCCGFLSQENQLVNFQFEWNQGVNAANWQEKGRWKIRKVCFSRFLKFKLKMLLNLSRLHCIISRCCGSPGRLWSQGPGPADMLAVCFLLT